MKLKRKSNKKGFTLIELMITVSVIAILSGILLQVVNPTALRKKTRDKQRISDLKRIQAALELYFADNRQYPISGWIRITGSDPLSTTLSTYLDSMPVDPQQNVINSNPYSNPDGNRYNYHSNGSDYIITAIMEIDTSNDTDVCHTKDYWTVVLGLAGDGSSYSTDDYCYAVTAP